MNKVLKLSLIVSILGFWVMGVSTADASTNLISNPSVEITGSTGVPQGWITGKWGTNTAAFTYPVAGFDGANAVKITVSNYSSGDAKWYFQEVPVTAGANYIFSDEYTSTVPTEVVAQFHVSSSSYSYEDLGSAPVSAGWAPVSKSFTVPAGATAVTIFHLLQANGSLTTDAFSLTQTTSSPTQFDTGMVTLDFDDGWASGFTNAYPLMQAANLKATYCIVSTFLGTPGYMTKANMLGLQAAGYEIASHSQTHPFLTQLTPAQMQQEIAGSKADLLSLGVTSVSSFAYPYGDYNAATDALVKQSYVSARSSDLGFNKKNGNKYNLQIQSVEVNTTVAQVQSWIDLAAKNKTWLILLFHQIDNKGGQYSITPTNFQKVVNYLVKQKSTVVTMSQGASLMAP